MLTLGLDAAAPLFEGFPGSYLVSGDAIFVDAIHTSAGNIILLGKLGFTKPYADVDFYPNGGVSQPQCEGNLSITCNHDSSMRYFEASISSSSCQEGFKSLACNSWNDFKNKKCDANALCSKMGYLSFESQGKGKQYLSTRKVYPYC